MQVFILGMHRSGTSALARVLNLMGLYFGGENVGTGRSAENVKGFWERRDVRDLNDAILAASGGDWDAVSKLDLDAMPSESKAGYESAAADIVLNLDAHRPWFVKEPRLCVLFPIWRQVLETPFAIHIHRNPLEVARSLHRRNGIPIPAGLALWEIYNVHALNATIGLPRHFVGYEDLLQTPHAVIESLHAFLEEDGGYTFRQPAYRELSSFLDPGLHRLRADKDEFAACATPSQVALYEYLTRTNRQDAPVEPSPGCLATLREHESTIDLAHRARLAEDNRERRTEHGLELQLAVRGVELKQAVAAKDDALARQDALARTLDRFHDLRRDLTANLAVANDRVTTLRKQQQRLERQVDDLRKSGERLSRHRDVLQRDVSALRADRDETRQERDVLQRDVNALRADRDETRQERDKARQERDETRQERDVLQRNVSALRADRDETRQERDQARQERDVLQRNVSALRADRDETRQERDQARQERDQTRQERDELRRTNATLRREGKALQHQRDALRDFRRASATAASATRAQATGLLRESDATIARRRVHIVELDEFIGHLSTGIRAWLGSRRWQLGDALLTLPRRLTFRRTATPVLALLQGAIDAHEANKATHRDAARSHARLLDDVPPTAVDEGIADEAVLDESRRTAALDRMLFDRHAALGRLADDIAERQRFAEELIRLSETLATSRRWRLGHFLLSLPGRLLGRGRPDTAAEALSALIREHRRDATRLAGLHPLQNPPSPRSGRPEPTDKPSAPPGPFALDEPLPFQNGNVAKPTPSAAAIETPSAPLFPSPVSDDVDVVVCVHNALEHVERCLRSVLARTTVPYRLIVVNDGSDAPTSERLREFDAEHDVVTLIETDGPLGYTCAANQGLRASTASNVALLNSDTIVPRLWLEEMLECMASATTVGIVGPLSNAASWQSVPERTGADGRWAVNRLPPGYNVDEYAELLWLSSKRRFPRVDFVNGFCFMVSRSVIERIGFLDEDNFPRGYGEENDYCIRAQDAGFELAIADHCFVYHAKSKSFGDATRDKLAQAGGVALERKHGKARIDKSSEALRDSTVLAEIRATARARIAAESALDGGCSARERVVGKHVLFVLPVRGGSGGANSVIQEAMGMRMLGVDAKVATHVKYLDDFERFYPEFLATGEHFIFYESDDDLMRHAAPFQVIVATLWSSPALVAPIATRWPDKLYVYYVQDYEPWFFEDDDQSRTIALDSYTLIPDMILMAKTDWICRTVQERHGKPVYRVAPSLDHSVFHPGQPRTKDGPVKIAAMVRPTTPRRGPLRTIRTLKHVIATCDQPVQVLLFGCETQHLNTYIARNAPELRLGRQFDSRGVLARQGVADLMREADIFVDLSDYQAFGRTGLEAMACGCAVVLPEEGGVYEYAVPGENCMVVDTESDDDMANTVQALVTDARLRTTITEHAIDTAKRFDIVRASVSEISVFRAAVAARFGHRSPFETHARGVGPEPESTQGTSHSGPNVSQVARRATVQSPQAAQASR